MEAKLTHAVNNLINNLYAGGDGDAAGSNMKRTMLIIAHRLSTIRRCDQIIYLDESGAIGESGTHDELIAIPNGRYRRLWELNSELESPREIDEVLGASFVK